MVAILAINHRSATGGAGTADSGLTGWSKHHWGLENGAARRSKWAPGVDGRRPPGQDLDEAGGPLK